MLLVNGEIIDKYKHRIYGLDECGGKVKHKSSKVLTFHGIAARREGFETPVHVTLVGIHDFNGNPVPPIIISPHVRFPPRELLEKTDSIWPECRLACSESGYINTNIFYFTVHHIVDFFKTKYGEEVSKKKPIILICDSHKSRLNSENLKEFQSLGVVIFLGTPNATHIYQCLDDLPFQQYQLQKAKNKEHMIENDISNTGVVDEAALCVQSLKEVMKDTTKYTKSALSNCGFIPWAPQKLESMSGLNWLMLELNSASLQPPRKKSKTTFDLLRGGAVATDRVFIEQLEQIQTNKKK